MRHHGSSDLSQRVGLRWAVTPIELLNIELIFSPLMNLTGSEVIMAQCFGSRKGMLALSLVLFLSRAVQGFLPFPAMSSSRSRSLPARVFLSATAPVEGKFPRPDPSRIPVSPAGDPSYLTLTVVG